MNLTNEQRHERFKQVPEAVRYLYSSDEAGKELYSVFKKHGFKEDLYQEYILVVGDVILGFYPKSKLPSLLVEHLQLTAEEAQDIFADLKNLLTPIQDQANPAEAEQAPEVSSENFTAYYAPRKPQPEPSALRPKPQSGALSPSRTMEGDMERAKAQDEKPAEEEAQNNVPRFAKPLTDTPRYDK